MKAASLVTQSGDDDGPRLEKLFSWAKTRHIWVHKDAQVGSMAPGLAAQEGKEGIDRLDDDCQGGESESESAEGREQREQRARGGGFGVFVKHGSTILERQVVVLVPKATLLSARTTSLAPHLPAKMLFSSDSTSGLLLALVLLHELLLGEKGPWWGYLQSLPRAKGKWGVPLPLSWPRDSEEWRWIRGTEAGRMVRRAEADPMGRIEGLGMSVPRLRAYFRTVGAAILRQAHPLLFTEQDAEEALLQDYICAHSIISSRSFVVDMFHGLCMVPIADMFNHSELDNMHFEADDEVCDECGSLGACPHNDDPLPSEAYGRPSSILPAESGPNSKDWTPPEVLVGVDTVDMVAQRDIAFAEEAYNTYGNFSNASLLTIYGFCLEYETEWERYVWEWRNADERSQVLGALDPDTATPKKRRRAADNEVQQEWVRTCAHFTRLPTTTFAELLEDWQIPKSGDSSVTLPLSSPFLALTQSATDPGAEMCPDAQLDEVVATHSMHDGSRDMYQPLYIDGQGRVSSSLWRAVVLYHISAAAAPDCDEESVRQGVRLVEQACSDVLADAVPPAGDEVLLRHVLSSLCALVQSRLDGMLPPAGLHILETMPPGLMRSAALHSLQETTALTTCLRWLKRCQDALGAASAIDIQ